MSSNALQIALDYAKRGLPVFPCGADKRPLVQGGFKAASKDPDQIAKWWTAYPGAMIGIPTGQASGLVVLDVDVDVEKGIDGFESLKQLEPLPKTLMVTTPRTGAHFYFKNDPDRPLSFSASQLGPGLDIRGDGGYIIAAGSVTSSGAYEVARDLPVADWPAWLGDKVASKKAHQSAPANDHAPSANSHSPANDRYVQAALHGEIGRLATAPAGQRNDALNRAAFSLGTLVGQGGLAEQEAHQALMSGATACGLLADDGANAVQATIRSGLGAGMANPRQMPDKARTLSAGISGLSGPIGGFEIETKPSLFAKPFAWTHWTTLPTRKWLYSRYFLRGFVTLTVATGGMGKSMLSIVEALSVATGQALLDKPVYDRANAWLFNLEDPQEEMKRRIMGACKRYDLSSDDISGRLFVNSGLETPLVIAEQPKNGLTIVAPVVENLIAQIKANQIGMLVIDPFVSCHQVSENDNGAIDLVAKKWAAIANETGCAVHLVHHSRKTDGKSDLSVEDARGASALLATARVARVLNRMSTDEAAKVGINDERFQYVKLSDGKANLAPMLSKSDWFKLESVSLDNAGADGNLTFMESDNVGVPVAWAWPKPEMVDDDEKGLILEHLTKNGPWRADWQSPEWVGYGVIEALGFDRDDKPAKARAKSILQDWIKSGDLEEYKDTCQQARKEKRFIRVTDHASPL